MAGARITRPILRAVDDIVLSAFEDLFRQFTDFPRPQKKFRGYRLPAMDGSSLKPGAYPTYPCPKISENPGSDQSISTLFAAADVLCLPEKKTLGLPYLGISG